MGCCHTLGYHHRYRCTACGEPLIPLGYGAPSPVYGAAPRDEYLRTLEGERELLEQRLRRLERELEELRAAGQRAPTLAE